MKKLTRQYKFIVILAFICILILAVVIGFIFTKGNKVEAKKTYDIYEIKELEPLTFTGKVQAAEQQIVSYDQSLGDITDIVGETEVKAGDALVTYSSSSNQSTLDEKLTMKNQYTSNITQLEEELSIQRSNFENAAYNLTIIKQDINTVNDWSDSSEKNSQLSELQIELNETQQAKQTAENQIRSIENSITSYKDMLADVDASIITLENTRQTVITADFDGTVKVNEKGREDGSVPVVTVYGKSQVVKTTVTEYDIEKLALEQPVIISYVNQVKEIEGKVSFIDTIPESDTENVAGYSVEISPTDSISLGYSVQIGIPQNEIRIPAGAVITETESKKPEKPITESDSQPAEETGQVSAKSDAAKKKDPEAPETETDSPPIEKAEPESDASGSALKEKYYVYKYEKGKAVKAEVVIEKQSNYVKVLSGLSIADKIIENPGDDIRNQMEVNIS